MFGLIIMDGFGINTANSDNAITMAGTPNFDKYVAKYPHTTLGASGLDVGLPDGQMGNSEVGHLNMGAGRVVYQDLTAISKQIADGDFFKNAELLGAMKNATKNRKKLHVMGLLGPGGVHSHIEHLQALIQMAKDNGVPEIYVHCFLDGRDVPPTSASGYIKELYAFMQSINYGKIASVCGRFYA
ncbi:MAG: 2,3-bisphosphoglycerate-independent phosphoglycerate mutase, partial [Clostridia bacterium]